MSASQNEVTEQKLKDSELRKNGGTSDGSHVPLEARSNISGLDSGFTTSYVTRGTYRTIACPFCLSASAQSLAETNDSVS